MTESATAAKATTKVGAIELPNAFLRHETQQKQATTTAPVDNPVYKILFSQELSPEQKRAEFAKFLAFTGTKEESRAHVQALEKFQDYLQEERERMAREIIQLTDTETASELQAAYRDLEGSLVEYENQMKPLTDIIDAVYTLR